MVTRFGDARDWFFEKRFGMFVHWGLYAIEGWHEQHQWRGSVPRAEYEKLIEQFNPTEFDPEAWLDLAQATGMEYICLTTKHHDGFCLWDTAQTDYNVMNSPYGKDILGQLAQACHRRKFPLCLYHSVVDWHHPNYPNAGRSHELPEPVAGDDPDLGRYLQFLVAQVMELCTQYGPIHGFWWDLNVTGVVDQAINNLIRELQPAAVINNRGFDDGDFGTPERDHDPTQGEILVYERPTEANQSIGLESWGYRKNEDYYADRHLMASIDRSLAKGGNYLLNVGPKADGTIPDEAKRILGTIGDWYGRIREGLIGTTPCSPLINNRDVLLTRQANTLYVHLHSQPIVSRVLLDPITIAPIRATLLNTGEQIDWSLDDLPTQHIRENGLLVPESPHYLRLANLPVNEHTGTVMVIKLEFEQDPLG